jgi:hypothetical protein
MQLVIRYPALASSMRFGLALRPLKAACIFAGSNAENTWKRSAHGKRRLKSKSIRDLLKTHRAAIDHLLCRLHAHAIDELPWTFPLQCCGYALRGRLSGCAGRGERGVDGGWTNLFFYISLQSFALA